MREPAGRAARPVEELFAVFLERKESEPELDFERWLEPHADRAVELRELHAGYQRLRSHLPGQLGGSGAGPTGLSTSLQRGYRILDELGHGGYGRVYRALDLVLQREVALKVLDENARISAQMRRRFLEEARVLARLDHSNIVRIHTIESHDGEIRLSLELVEGRTLQAIVDESGPLSAEETAQVGVELCRALAAIHAEGLVHMDVKPGNVMRAAGGRIVLLDFGFARPTGPPAGNEGSPIGGTPPFMSPEHFEGRADIGPRSDVYSLGVLLYWLVSGRYPYAFEDLGQLGEQVLAGRATPLLDVRPELPSRLVEVVERAMARRETDRYGSAGEMEEALRSFLAGRGSEGTARSVVRGTRMRILIPSLAILLAAALWLLPRIVGSEPFQLEYGFYRDAEEGALPLEDGDTVAVGDELYLRVRSPEAFYLYVFNQDERGNWYRLLPAGEVSNLNEANSWHRFPSSTWIVNSVGEREHLYVVASPHRVAFADELAAIIPPTGRNQGDLTRGERERIERGIGGLSEPAPDETYFELEERFARFRDSLAATERVLAAHHVLRNEGR